MDKNKNPHVVEEEENNAVAEEALTSPGKQSPSSLSPSPAPPNPPSSFDFPAPTNPNSSPFPTRQSPSIGKLRNPQSTRSDFNSGDLDRSNHGDDVVTDDVDLAQPKKKPRTVWSLKLHTKFVEAVNQLGEEYAVPSNILKRMNEKGLTRQAVASHLQKYRKYLRSQKANSGESSTTDPQFANIPFSFGPPPPSPPPLMSQNVVQPQQQNVDLRQTVGDVSTLPPDFLGLAPPNVDEKNEEGGNEEGGRS